MKRIIRRLILLSLTVYLLVCCCACKKDEPQAVSLIKGELVLQTEQLTKYDDAFLMYDDPFMVAIATTQTQEMLATPDFSGEITELRVSFPKRDLPMTEYFGSQLYSETLVCQIFYGYSSDGVWRDFPAQNYALKSLSSSAPASDGAYAILNDHVVRIGPYLLIGIVSNYYNTQSVSVQDSLNSSVLSFEQNETKMKEQELSYLYFEENSDYTDADFFYYCPSIDHYYYMAVEFDTLPKDYVVSVIKEWANGTETTTYTYEDIMSALERE